uniref:C2H2-type domain-containing protein n=1 Tax=Strongyloides stercoralis TaxID=6248 RepID=A0A0K0ET92_STRER
MENYTYQLPDNKHQFLNMESNFPIQKSRFSFGERNPNKPDCMFKSELLEKSNEIKEEFQECQMTQNTTIDLFEGEQNSDSYFKFPSYISYCDQGSNNENCNNESEPSSINISPSQIVVNECGQQKRSINVTSIRARKDIMTIDELQECLEKKLEEKVLCKVPVKLIDRTHVKCNICDSIISLNKKFEIVHVVRHFLAWHKTDHICTRTWPGLRRFYNKDSNIFNNSFEGIQTFSETSISFISKRCNKTTDMKINSKRNNRLPYGLNSKESFFNIKCELCGEIMEHRNVFTHFQSFHSKFITIPECNLCVQEVIINAELKLLYKLDFQLSIIDEGNFISLKTGEVFNGIDGLYKKFNCMNYNISSKINNNTSNVKKISNKFKVKCLNNSTNLGGTLRPKRIFVHPKYRQAVPENSLFVEEVETNCWRCKLCGSNIVGAVISSAAIKHFRKSHFEDGLYFDTKTMKNKYNPKSLFYQFCMELCDARLSKCSKGLVKMIDEKTVVCNCCDRYIMTLHKEFNICRGIRHLKLKHPDLMPEYNGVSFQEENSHCDYEGNENTLVKEEHVVPPDNECHTLVNSGYLNYFQPLLNVENSITGFYNPKYDNTIQNDQVYDNLTLPVFLLDSSSKNGHSKELDKENYNEYLSYTTLPSQEVVPMMEIAIENGYEDFYTKIPYERYNIPLEKVDTILKIYDIDGTECYILMTEEDNFDHETASKIFYKNYLKI